MKTIFKLLCISLISLVLLSFSFESKAQASRLGKLPVYNEFADDTIKNANVTFSVAAVSLDYSGIMGFQYTRDNVSVYNKDSVAMWGSCDRSNWLWVAGSSATTEGTFFLSQTPPKFPYYKLIGYNVGGATDTTIIKDVIQIQKKQ